MSEKWWMDARLLSFWSLVPFWKGDMWKKFSGGRYKGYSLSLKKTVRPWNIGFSAHCLPRILSRSTKIRVPLRHVDLSQQWPGHGVPVERMARGVSSPDSPPNHPKMNVDFFQGNFELKNKGKKMEKMQVCKYVYLSNNFESQSWLPKSIKIKPESKWEPSQYLGKG